LWLEDADLAVDRVAQRVAQGGHSVPEDVIRRRYEAGLRNVLKSYLPLADTAIIFDNSSVESQKLVASKKFRGELEIEDKVVWEKILKGAYGKKE